MYFALYLNGAENSVDSHHQDLTYSMTEYIGNNEAKEH